MSNLYNKARPKVLSEFRGNEQVVAALNTLIDLPPENRPKAYMFVGESGTGKTTMARIMARNLGCDPGDELSVVEVNAANIRGIDGIRQLDQDCQTLPMTGGFRCVILDEAQQLTKEAQNALLKLLEDTPPATFFFICTTDPEKLIPAIHTRCSKFRFSRLPDSVMSSLVNATAEAEGAPQSEGRIAAIVEAADGCPRTAMVALEAIMNIEDDADAIEALVKIADAHKTSMYELCRVIAQSPASPTLARKVLSQLQAIGVEEYESARRLMLSFFSSVLLKVGPEHLQRPANQLDIIVRAGYMESGKAGLPGFVNMVYKVCVVDLEPRV